MLDAAHVLAIQGNHEAIFSGSLTVRAEAPPVIAHPPQDDPVVRSWAQRCAGIGPAREIRLGGRRILMVHAGPADPLQERVTRPEDVRAGGHDIVLMGHSHRPFLGRTADGALALNPGSCGQPRDHGGLLSLAVLETDGPHAEIFRLPFVHDAELLRRAHPDVRRVAARREPATGLVVRQLARQNVHAIHP